MASKAKPRALSLEQLKFIDGWIEHGSMQKAMLDAGYSEATARGSAGRTLRLPSVVAEINRRFEEHGMGAVEVIARLSAKKHALLVDKQQHEAGASLADLVLAAHRVRAGSREALPGPPESDVANTK